MPSPAFIVAKLTLARQLSVNNTCTKFNEKPTNILFADTKYLSEVRTEVVCKKGVFFCYFVTKPKFYNRLQSQVNVSCDTFYTN
jgi:hypothetical protein